MSASQIKTVRDLLDYLYTLEEKAGTLSLELYLRSLWGLIQRNKNTPVSPALAGKLFTDALGEEPVPFDKEWLQYETLPLRRDVADDYEYLQRVIPYQIADLHRIKDLEISPVDRYFGFKSPTGYTWYNSDLAGYLECAVAGFYSHSEDIYEKDKSPFLDPFSSLNDSEPIGKELNSTEFSWRDVAEILCLVLQRDFREHVIPRSAATRNLLG